MMVVKMQLFVDSTMDSQQATEQTQQKTVHLVPVPTLQIFHH